MIPSRASSPFRVVRELRPGAALLVLLAAGAAEARQPAPVSDSIRILGFRREVHGESVHLVVACSAPVDYNYQSSDSLSVRLELLAVDPGGVSAPSEAWAGEVDAISLSRGDGSATAILDLHFKRFAPYRVRSAGNELTVVLNPPRLAALRGAEPAAVPAVEPAAGPAVEPTLPVVPASPASASELATRIAETSPDTAPAPPLPEAFSDPEPAPPLPEAFSDPEPAPPPEAFSDPEPAPPLPEAPPDVEPAPPLPERLSDPEHVFPLRDVPAGGEPATPLPELPPQTADVDAPVEPEPARPDLPFELPPDPAAPPPIAEPPAVEAAAIRDPPMPAGPRATRVFEASRADRDGWLAVRIATNGVPAYSAFFTEDQPHRLVVDVDGTESRPLFSRLPVDVGVVAQVRIGQHAAEPVPIVRIVFDLDDRVPHRIEADVAGLTVIFQGIPVPGGGR